MKSKIIFIFLLSSFIFSNTPITLINQKNKPPSEFYREFKEVRKCKLEYLYNLEGKTTFSGNYGKSNRLLSKTSYRNNKSSDVFIYFKDCFNKDCYSEE